MCRYVMPSTDLHKLEDDGQDRNVSNMGREPINRKWSGTKRNVLIQGTKYEYGGVSRINSTWDSTKLRKGQ